MTNNLDLFVTCYQDHLAVDEILLRKWFEITYTHCAITCAEVSVGIVNAQDGEYYNSVFRKRPGPTNVLSFPDDAQGGEIILCDPVILKEANMLGLSPIDRYFQVYIHGLLHLLGYTHEHDEDTAIMESLEDNLFEIIQLNQT